MATYFDGPLEMSARGTCVQVNTGVESSMFYFYLEVGTVLSLGSNPTDLERGSIMWCGSNVPTLEVGL